MKTINTKTIAVAFASLFLFSCDRNEEQDMVAPMQASIDSEFGTHPTTCNLVRSFGVESTPKAINYIEEERAKIIIKGERRGHNGKYLDENMAKAFKAPRTYNDNKTINLLGHPTLLSLGKGEDEAMHEDGGRLILDFSPVGTVTMKSFIVYDINETDAGSKVELFSSTGQLLATKALPSTKDKDISFVGFDGDVPGVAKMIVTFGEERKFAGSGGISMLQMCIEGEGRYDDARYMGVRSIWMEYTGSQPANVNIIAKNGASNNALLDTKGMKPGTIFKLSAPYGSSLGETLEIETNRREKHSIAIMEDRNATLNKQYGNFRVIEARCTDYPLRLK
jgi:hypothetical protein